MASGKPSTTRSFTGCGNGLVRDAIAKPTADDFCSLVPPSILNGIVKQSSNCSNLVSAVLKDYTDDGEQM